MSYSALQTKIAQWLNRTDLAEVIPDFIALTEERMSRYLRTNENEIALAPTAIVDNKITVPSGAVAVKSLWLDGYEGKPLKLQSTETVIASGSQGLASIYSWVGNEFLFDGTGTVVGVLYAPVPALSGLNPSNWILSKHQSLYLFGALAEANAYLKNAEEAMLWNARFDAILAEVNNIGSVGLSTGPLVARAR